MRRHLLVWACAIVLMPLHVLAQSPPADAQIKTALQAAPAPLRAEATVLGYTDDRLITLREGSGSLICLADNPQTEGFHVACYHESLGPFMRRGRELRRQGVSAIDSVRHAEIERGDLSYPNHPAALYNLSGTYDVSTDTLRDASRLHVVYVPYATGPQTGLPTHPQDGGGPWLMEPGQPWAHIMTRVP